VTSPHPTGSGIWTGRRARAERLAEEAPHASEMLRTYAALTEVQEAVSGRTPAGRWLTSIDVGADGPVRLRLERLPVEELLPLFADYLSAASALGTKVMRAEARELTGGVPRGAATELIRAALRPASDSGGDRPFHVRAFLQPIVTTLAVSLDAAPSARGGRCCPTCGARPVVGVFEDLPDALGSRSLICDACSTSWRTPRLTCVGCGESDPGALAVRQPESLPHIRVDECTRCGRYIKAVDLRQAGNAVPLVEDLATPELDLWARESGLSKVQANLFGL